MNLLAAENSSYLLQHADNPVNWYPWGEDAFLKASFEDKPVFLSIGYSACHWCHVMAHESFEDPATAAILNKYYVSIKVDREERPDIDRLYMDAVVALTGHGGWPMSVFLTPEGKPFYGGTYFPPKRRYNLPAFQEVLYSLANIWKDDRSKVLTSADNISEHVQALQDVVNQEYEPVILDLDRVTEKLLATYDWKFGGWGNAPKFPQPMVIEFLLRRGARGDNQAAAVAIHALRSMAKGGMYDVLGGGFSRYSTDESWLIPHFEKMLYDNAQLAKNYLYAYLITRDEDLKLICTDTIDFIIRELSTATNPDTRSEIGFFSSLDADSEGEEGVYYLFTKQEIVDYLGVEANLFITAYGITDYGNFEGKNILSRVKTDEELAVEFRKKSEEISTKLIELKSKLWDKRNQRIRPATDDKVLSGWNGLMLDVLAEAGRYLDRPDYIDLARKNATFIIKNLYVDGFLHRSYRAGKAKYFGTLEDYASIVNGLFSLYQADYQNKWYIWAMKLLSDIKENFVSENSLFFDTHISQKDIKIRPKSYQDNATPSGNGLLAYALIIASAFSGDLAGVDWADRIVGGIYKMIKEYPLMFGKWLCAIDRIQNSHTQVVLVGNPDHPRFKEFLDILHSAYLPDLIVATTIPPVLPDGAPILENKVLMNNLPTAYVCQNFYCDKPTNSPDEINRQLIPRK